MGVKKVSLRATLQHHEKRLDQILSEWLPRVLDKRVTRGKARRLILIGGVYLDGRRCRIASKKIFVGVRIEVAADLDELFEEESRLIGDGYITVDDILYEDDDLIAINKPAQLPTEAALTNTKESAYEALKKLLQGRDGKTDFYLGLHHRLDTETSGVLLLTRSKRANPGIAAEFSDHQARKVYHALCYRNPKYESFPNVWEIQNHLDRQDSTRNRQMKMEAVTTGGNPAHTEFQLLETLERALWVEARPLTGRSHQIRVHLADSGLPILGDSLYLPRGIGKPPSVNRLMLHAASLTITHPATKRLLTIEAPLPEDFLQAMKRFKQKRPLKK